MINKYMARRSFYSGGNMIKRGEPVEINDPARLQALMGRRLIVKIVEDAAPTPGPSETKVIQPAETKQPVQDPVPDPVEDQQQTDQVPENDTPPENDENAPPRDFVDYGSLEYKDLKEAAKQAGIKGYSSMKKEDLIKTLNERQKGEN